LTARHIGTGGFFVPDGLPGQSARPTPDEVKMDCDPFSFLGFSLEQWLDVGRFAVLLIDKARKWLREAKADRREKPKEDDQRTD
tara:strand:- start:27 stop:278 length:252 start_codon:yes stop_codon:yes gene_type:complete